MGNWAGNSTSATSASPSPRRTSLSPVLIGSGTLPRPSSPHKAGHVTQSPEAASRAEAITGRTSKRSELVLVCAEAAAGTVQRPETSHWPAACDDSLSANQIALGLVEPLKDR